ncbi:AMP-binding protein [Streptomyces sp. NPDC001852]|uniref:AMP-binding protein n=1 Tax=Streptomyces sp. NPDC001852 TaxID=3364619 RepID=UPI00368DF32F
MNLASHVVNSARVYPDRTALRLGDDIVTYRTLDQRTARVAAMLRNRGVRPGDHVGLMLTDTPEFAFAYFGVLRAGGVVVPMNFLLKSSEVAYHLGDSGARLLFAWHDFADEARAGAQQAGAEAVVVDAGGFDELPASGPSASDMADRHENDTAVVLDTSGTTGEPKGSELTHGNLTHNCSIAAGRDAGACAITAERLTAVTAEIPPPRTVGSGAQAASFLAVAPTPVTVTRAACRSEVPGTLR